MEEVTIYKSYGEYKATLDAELKTNVESFMRIGYLLKVARDTEILSESGYKNVAEFAQAEYGLTKDIVSRYIAINDRYSENGYSERLKTEFEGYGVAKLSEMLTLPDSIIAEIEPTLTRKEIQDIKKEIAEEDAITPMEVLMEEKEVTELSFTEQCWKEWLKNNPDKAAKLKEIHDNSKNDYFEDIEEIFDVLAPTGMQILWARLSGIGKIMISIKGVDDPITFTNSRDGSKVEQTSAAMTYELEKVLADYEPPKVESKVIENVTESAEVLGVNPPEETPEEVKEDPSEEQTEEPTEEAAEAAVEEPKEEPEEEPEKVEKKSTVVNLGDIKPISDSFSQLSEVDKIWHNVNTEMSILNTKIRAKNTKSSYATIGVIKKYLEKIMEVED